MDCKKVAKSLSIKYRSQPALGKEETGELKTPVYLRQRNNIEVQRRLSRNIRHAEGKIKGDCTSRVITKDNGVLFDHTNKSDIGKSIAASNETLVHQTEGGSQLLSPLS